MNRPSILLSAFALFGLVGVTSALATDSLAQPSRDGIALASTIDISTLDAPNHAKDIDLNVDTQNARESFDSQDVRNSFDSQDAESDVDGRDTDSGVDGQDIDNGLDG